MPCVARVTISVGSLNRAITAPFTSPSVAPITIAITSTPMTPGSMPPRCDSEIVVYAAKIAIAGNETSMPPEMMMSSTASANTVGTSAERRIENRVCTEKKSGFTRLMTRTRSAMMPTSTHSLVVRNVFGRFVRGRDVGVWVSAVMPPSPPGYAAVRSGRRPPRRRSGLGG
ncbi:hypothetical protein EVAR_73758_1 [Eumeta japonica]|uniref:Uncharacterized protein n=1 Tax=Eumeta variegata TaxID=151549 RepID=A0A4C1ST10_EUMVA|nr:hypothetical protein EVAR_73758_1 [Eumeta japonica]